MSELRRSHRVVAALLAAAFASMTACQEGAVAPRAATPPIDQMSNLGTYMVDVDLKTGKVTSYPVESSNAPSAVDASIIGGTATIFHNFQLMGGAPTTGNHFTLTDRIENKNAFAIGTHLRHATGVFPEDTMGVYVFVSIAPTVIAGCTQGPTCNVTVDSTDGAFPFTSPTAQPYMFFKTILEAADGTLESGLDYTNQLSLGGSHIDYFRSIVFKASSAVTNFKFGVTVSTALVAPNATRWRVGYTGDSLPNRVGTGLADLRSEPDWRRGASAGAVIDTSIIATGCPAGGTTKCLRISSVTPANGALADDSLFYYRSDSLATGDNAYISASVTVSGNKPNNPTVFIGMQDRVHLMLFGISQNKIGFCDGNGAFVGTPTTINATSYRISKFGTDSVVVYLDGATTSSINVAYSTLPGAPPVATPNKFFWFGNRVQFASSPKPSGDISLWSNVVYEIGVTGP